MNQENKRAEVPGGIVSELRTSSGRFRKRQLVAVAFCFALGAGMLAGSFLGSNEGGNVIEPGRGMTFTTFLRWGGVFFLAVSILGVLIILRTAAKRARVIGVLSKKPEGIVWLYLEDVGAAGFRRRFGLALRPHLYLVDGTGAWFQVSREVSQSLFDCFMSEFPGTSLGYSAELQKRFKKDPASLRSSPVRTSDRKVATLRPPPVQG